VIGVKFGGQAVAFPFDKIRPHADLPSEHSADINAEAG
jgi:hypothetical protein